MFTHDHELYRSNVARFITEKIEPSHAKWEEDGLIPRDIWKSAGQAGLLLPSIPDTYGGGGGDFLYSAVVLEEIARAAVSGVTGFTTHSENVAPYLLEFGTEAQKAMFLPQMASGEVVGSLGMTEPGAGSDLKAIPSSPTAITRTACWCLQRPLRKQARAASACFGSIRNPKVSAVDACSTR
jgi:alkylation response protein AidB-like acyl-CoA dehydrogenase